MVFQIFFFLFFKNFTLVRSGYESVYFSYVPQWISHILNSAFDNWFKKGAIWLAGGASDDSSHQRKASWRE